MVMYMKAIMSKEEAEIYIKDIKSLSDTINNEFHNEKVTVWHCCTSDGYGYYTLSNGEKKRFVRSEYRLEYVGGVWSLRVYERLYMGQVHLMRFLESVKDVLSRRFSVEMPLKTLYIAYILYDLDKWEDTRKKNGFEENKCDFEIARTYQKEFIQQYPEQIEIYNTIIANGGNFWSYYNGADNYEYSCVSDILKNAVSEIYKNRKQLETCELWEQAKKVVDVIAKYNINEVSAKWKKIQDYALCSKCGHKVNWGSKDFLSPYCPHCGERMERDK